MLKYKYRRSRVQLKQTRMQEAEDTGHMITCSLVDYTQRQQLMLVKQLQAVPTDNMIWYDVV